MEDIERNLKALEFLKEGKFASAQALFIKNMKLYPSYSTYNNLGRFFAEYGNERKDGKVVSAKKTAFRYLKKSLELSPNISAYRNLAYFSYELYLYGNGSLDDAETYQEEVLKLHGNYEDIYNYAVILYELGKYNLGLEVLDKIVKNYNEASLLYLLYLLKLDKLSIKTVKVYQEMIDGLDLFAQQYFYYYCQDYSRVVSVTESFASCCLEVDQDSLAVYIDSLLMISSAIEIKKHLNEICKKIEVESKDFMDLLNNEPKRNLQIKRYQLKPIMQAVCGFCGCPIHNTAW